MSPKVKLKYFSVLAGIFLFFCFTGVSAKIHSEPRQKTLPGSVKWLVQIHGNTTLLYQLADESIVPGIVDYVEKSRNIIESFFGKSFPETFVVHIFPNRVSLSAFWRKAWKLPDFEAACWMVGSGSSTGLTLLSPRVWRKEACEHDPDDRQHVQRLIAHEMVHIFHAQVNPLHNLDDLEPIGWFVEGLAVYVSGQLEGAYLADPREAVLSGKAPTKLENAWSGKYRYGVSGTLVKFIDKTYGRDVIKKLLVQTTEPGILKFLGTTEKKFLRNWREFVLNDSK